MKTIEEITFVHETKRCSYKIYKHEEEIFKKVKIPVKLGEITLERAYKYADTKVKVTKYTLHQEFEIDGKYQDKLVCETEMYATILTILKGILTEYIETINKLQAPVI